MCSCLDPSISIVTSPSISIVTSPYLSVFAYVYLSVPTSFHLSTRVCVCRSFSFYFFACFCPFVVSFPFSLLIHRSVDLAIYLIVYLSADISKSILAILNLPHEQHLNLHNAGVFTSKSMFISINICLYLSQSVYLPVDLFTVYPYPTNTCACHGKFSGCWKSDIILHCLAVCCMVIRNGPTRVGRRSQNYLCMLAFQSYNRWSVGV